MKKYLLLIVLLVIPFIRINAEVELTVIDHYENNYGYSIDGLITNTWAIDLDHNKYVRFDNNGTKMYEVSNPNDDPMAKKGKINIKAEVPDNLKDEVIVVNIATVPYEYEFKLNRDNNFSVLADMNVSDYTDVYVYVKEHDREYEITYPSVIIVFEGKTTLLSLDYSKYKKSNSSTKKKVNNKRIIIYIFIGFVVVFVLVLAMMFFKTRNI